MISVYQCTTAVEAYMILNLLQQSGIDGRVDGEYLQGGMGEIQAIDLVRVLVADEDAPRAREIIAEWEARAVEPVQRGKSRGGTGKGIVSFLVGLALGVGMTYLTFRTPVDVFGIDYDGNGVYDERFTYRGDKIALVEVDWNRDEEWDEVHDFGRRGTIRQSKHDNDFDGVFEHLVFYRGGLLAREETDLDGDGEAERRGYYRHGVLVRYEIGDEAAGTPFKRQYFEHGRLVRDEFDKDGDGVFEVHRRYDRFEEPVNGS